MYSKALAIELYTNFFEIILSSLFEFLLLCIILIVYLWKKKNVNLGIHYPGHQLARVQRIPVRLPCSISQQFYIQQCLIVRRTRLTRGRMSDIRIQYYATGRHRYRRSLNSISSVREYSISSPRRFRTIWHCRPSHEPVELSALSVSVCPLQRLNGPSVVAAT